VYEYASSHAAWTTALQFRQLKKSKLALSDCVVSLDRLRDTDDSQKIRPDPAYSFLRRLHREKQDEERTGGERQRANEQIEFQAELRH
jgi:hypothetical protein